MFKLNTQMLQYHPFGDLFKTELFTGMLADSNITEYFESQPPV